MITSFVNITHPSQFTQQMYKPVHKPNSIFSAMYSPWPSVKPEETPELMTQYPFSVF